MKLFLTATIISLTGFITVNAQIADTIFTATGNPIIKYKFHHYKIKQLILNEKDTNVLLEKVNEVIELGQAGHE